MNNDIKEEIEFMCSRVRRSGLGTVRCAGLSIANGVSEDDMRKEFATRGYIYKKSEHDSSFRLTLQLK